MRGEEKSDGSYVLGAIRSNPRQVEINDVRDEVGEEIVTGLGDDQSVVVAGWVGGRGEEGNGEEGVERLRMKKKSRMKSGSNQGEIERGREKEYSPSTFRQRRSRSR
jgi:hypothetical protein